MAKYATSITLDIECIQWLECKQFKLSQWANEKIKEEIKKDWDFQQTKK